MAREDATHLAGCSCFFSVVIDSFSLDEEKACTGTVASYTSE